MSKGKVPRFFYIYTNGAFGSDVPQIYKTMKHLLMCLGTAVVTIIGLHLLGVATLILSGLADLLFGASHLERFLEDATDFLFIFSGEYPVGSIVVAIMVWIILWILIEVEAGDLQ